jgi:hypothetical protein
LSVRETERGRRESNGREEEENAVALPRPVQLARSKSAKKTDTQKAECGYWIAGYLMGGRV